MHPLLVALTELEHTLDSHVAQVLDIAEHSPAGGAGRWLGLLDAVGLSGADDRRRGAAEAAAGQARGAPADELDRVIAVLCERASGGLSWLCASSGPREAWPAELGARVELLERRIAELPAEVRADYRRRLDPKPKTGAGLAGIFANVRATAEINPWNAVRWQDRLTLCCPGCGSPQRIPLVFDCSYCGTPLFARPDG